MIAVFVCSLVSCSVSNSKFQEPIHPPGKGTLVVARKKQFTGIAVPQRVFLNGERAGWLWAGQYLELPLSPGDYDVTFSLSRPAKITVNEGKTSYALGSMQVQMYGAPGVTPYYYANEDYFIAPLEPVNASHLLRKYRKK